MGVIAMRPMLNAGYDVKLASGAITAGGTLGILIPPSVMLIVYAAVAGQSIVKLYAAAMLPGFFLTFLYLVYILGWAIINPKIAPKLPPDQYRVAVPEYLQRLQGRSGSVVPGLIAAGLRPGRAGYGVLGKHLLVMSVPIFLTVGTFAATWWYVVVYNAPEAVATTAVLANGRSAARNLERALRLGGPARGADRRGAGGDPVRHLHRDRIGGDRRARRPLPRGDVALHAPGPVVEPDRLCRRHHARLVRG